MSTSAVTALAPIGIFDSGVGGLSVLRHIRAELPHESLCYFADSGFAPYGEKSESEIMQRTLYAAQNLRGQGVKAIVVACNTATAAAIALLRAHYPDLILVGVEPGLKPAASLSRSGYVGVIATTSTLASAKYQLLCDQTQQSSQIRVINQACPGLVTLIEHGELDSATTIELLSNFLQPIFQSPADVLVLGCTHYPFVEATIKLIAARANRPDIQIIDTGSAIAKQLQRLLTQRQLLNQSAQVIPLSCTTSGDSIKLQFALTHLLGLSHEQFTIQEIDCNLPPS